MSRMGPDTPFKVNVGFFRGGMSINTKAGKDIRAKIGSGDIQLVVGTHALLSKSVPYNNLGTLVIDEVQRFGVKQKERLKLISSGLHVVTLSATPIPPRTLYMSLSGIRYTSAIRSPPPLRMSIISAVERY
jgi:transcription-repair coupling factor (superfamily II helicase)